MALLPGKWRKRSPPRPVPGVIGAPQEVSRSDHDLIAEPAPEAIAAAIARLTASLADQLESGVLVRRDGDGHTGYGAGNECVDETVERYLVSGVVPDGTVDC